MNEKDFRDVCAMFAMNGILKSYAMSEVFEEQHEFGFKKTIAKDAYKMADAMLEARNAEPEQEVGIVAAKTRRKKND